MMESDQILDHDFNRLIEPYLLEKEGVEWAGKPRAEFSVTLLELDGDYNVFTGAMSLFGLILGGMTIGGYIFYTTSNWTGFALTMLTGVGLILLPDIIKHIRKKNTRYAVTKNRIFFNLWRWGKKSIYIVDFSDLVKITWQEYEDKSGVIHFMTKDDPGFYTYDFLTGRRRDYPTFEMQPDVVELWNKLERLRMERIRSKEHHVPK